MIFRGRVQSGIQLSHIRCPPSRIDAPALSVQIHDIETRYLTDANPRGNAVRGEHTHAAISAMLCFRCCMITHWSDNQHCHVHG